MVLRLPSVDEAATALKVVRPEEEPVLKKGVEAPKEKSGVVLEEVAELLATVE